MSFADFWQNLAPKSLKSDTEFWKPRCSEPAESKLVKHQFGPVWPFLLAFNRNVMTVQRYLAYLATKKPKIPPKLDWMWKPAVHACSCELLLRVRFLAKICHYKAQNRTPISANNSRMDWAIFLGNISHQKAQNPALHATKLQRTMLAAAHNPKQRKIDWEMIF